MAIMRFQESFVCGDCLDDPSIQSFIADNAVAIECTFCSETNSEPFAAPVDEVAAHITASLREEYGDAAGQLGYDSAEGGYYGDYWTTAELLLDVIELELPKDMDDTLLTELLSHIEDITWCEKNAYGLDDQNRARFSWAQFCEVIMHRRRYFFRDYDDPSSETYSPGEVLEKMFEDSERYDLFQELPTGTKLFRARFQEPGTKLTTTQELGPPPKRFAIQSNRMSPPGIPMFYGCDDPSTCLRETANELGRFAIGCFETRRPARILDLTRIPAIPSIFEAIPDSLEFRPREVLGFLNHIADEISRPIQRDNRIHINYIPTQVVTEYVRTRLTRGGARIDGIKYESAVHPGNASYVIFATQDNLLPIPEGPWVQEADRWLELTLTSENDVAQWDIDQWQKQLPQRYREDYQQSLYGEE